MTHTNDCSTNAFGGKGRGIEKGLTGDVTQCTLCVSLSSDKSTLQTGWGHGPAHPFKIGYRIGRGGYPGLVCLRILLLPTS